MGPGVAVGVAVGDGVLVGVRVGVAVVVGVRVGDGEGVSLAKASHWVAAPGPQPGAAWAA